MKTSSKLYYSVWAIAIIVASLTLTHLRNSREITASPTSPSRPTTLINGTGTPEARGHTSQNKQPSSVKSIGDTLKLPFPSNSQEYSVTKNADKLITNEGKTYPLRIYKPAIIPNDTYANQWWVAPTSMASTWDLPAGSRATKIAIIDTGFALNHQDLTGRWATNNNESGATSSQAASVYNCSARSLTLDKSCNLIDDNFDGIVDNESGATTKQNPSKLNCTDQGIAIDKKCNRLDDDVNGLVDDYRGWDFSNFDNSVLAGEVNSGGTGTTHGTMVAGVLGATANNATGVAGVNWYSSILPIQALDDDSYGDSLTVSRAIHYAVDQGSDVISISLGTSQEDPYIREAVEYATDHNSLVVAASGNEGCNCINYPANYPEVIAVGALDQTNNPASFSNYGHNLDILAPGASMTSTYWTASNQTSAYASNIAGTSFATPFTSALLGLGRSYQPNASWDEIVGAMFENSDRRTLTTTSPRSDTLGFGAVRGSTMLERLRTTDSNQQRYQFGPVNVQGSKNIYQCASSLPATLLYGLTKPSQKQYASGTLGYYKAANLGWTQSELMYTCIGLPTDTPSAVRTIDLNREIYNLSIKQ